FHNRPDLVAQDGKTTLKDCIVMASNGEPIPPHMDVTPDSNKCVEISTRSSVREMIAPGTYAVLAPLFVGFLVGPATLVGVLGGAIVSGAMVAIMMSNAGGAWDNAKKYCEKDGTKGLSKEKNDDGSAAASFGIQLARVAGSSLRRRRAAAHRCRPRSSLKYPRKKAHYDACVVGD
ncbi:MAG: sodium/proton-translocating pyrophosphatase, partial [Acidimicrobiales bacterium]|nr:sodium/proton-translocating pyrophosphatase [Acidimicrobiales bacterium]